MTVAVPCTYRSNDQSNTLEGKPLLACIATHPVLSGSAGRSCHLLRRLIPSLIALNHQVNCSEYSLSLYFLLTESLIKGREESSRFRASRGEERSSQLLTKRVLNTSCCCVPVCRVSSLVARSVKGRRVLFGAAAARFSFRSSRSINDDPLPQLVSASLSAFRLTYVAQRQRKDQCLVGHCVSEAHGNKRDCCSAGRATCAGASSGQ